MTRPVFAAYVRVSKLGGRSEADLQSPEIQRQAILQLAEREGFDVEWLNPELGVSGAKADRAAIMGAVDRVEAGELAGIAVYKLDRLSRLAPRQRVELFDRIEGNEGEKPGRVKSASEDHDPTTARGRFVRDLFLSLARMQWEEARDNFASTRAAAIDRGVWTGNRVPCGYLKGVDRRLYPDPATAAHVGHAFHMRAGGAGPSAIARYLEDHGVRTAQGSTGWAKSSVLTMLKAAVYGQVPGVVDEPTRRGALGATATQTIATRTAEPWALLSGRARCAACGYMMTASTTGRGYRLYRCPGARSAGGCPARASIGAEALEAAVVESYFAPLDDGAASYELVDTDAVLDLDDLQRAADHATELLDQASSVEAQAAFGTEWLAMVTQRRNDAEVAHHALADAAAQRAQAERRVSPDAVRASWDALPLAERSAAISSWFDAIAVGFVYGGKAAQLWPAGSVQRAGLELTRRGYKRTPQLRPFPAFSDLPAEVDTIALSSRGGRGTDAVREVDDYHA